MSLNLLNAINDPSQIELQIFFLAMAGFRIYLEIIKFNFLSLPLTKAVFSSEERSQRFHKIGLYLSIFFILTLAPNFIFR